jgi:hypothetical protein
MIIFLDISAVISGGFEITSVKSSKTLKIFITVLGATTQPFSARMAAITNPIVVDCELKAATIHSERTTAGVDPFAQMEF